MFLAFLTTHEKLHSSDVFFQKALPVFLFKIFQANINNPHKEGKNEEK